MLKIGVLASGRGTNLQAIIDSVGRGKLNVEIVVVISDNKGATALERARKNNIYNCFLAPDNYSNTEKYEENIIEVLEERGVDLVVLAGFMRILSPCIVNYYKNRIINIHPSLLPAFPGLDAQKQALDYGVKVSGCTVHFVDEGMDTGPIILQKAVPVYGDDTLDDLEKRILKEEHRLLPQAVEFYSKDKLKIEDNKVIIVD